MLGEREDVTIQLAPEHALQRRHHAGVDEALPLEKQLGAESTLTDPASQQMLAFGSLLLTTLAAARHSADIPP